MLSCSKNGRRCSKSSFDDVQMRAVWVSVMVVLVVVSGRGRTVSFVLVGVHTVLLCGSRGSGDGGDGAVPG